MESSLTHVMLVSFPSQGHINPLLRLGKLIASKGLLVTFVTTEKPFGKKMRQANEIQDGSLKPVGLGFLRFEFFDDGFTLDDLENKQKSGLLFTDLEVAGKREIKKLIKRYEEMKQPVRCLINNAFVPWGHVPRNIPRDSFLGIFRGTRSSEFSESSVPRKFPMTILRNISSKLPRIVPSENPSKYPEEVLPRYIPRSFPTNWLSSEFPRKFVSSEFRRKFPRKFREKMNFRGVISEDLFRRVLNSGLSFLWVVRPPIEGLSLETHVLPRELEDKGMIVEWCPQERVLAHPAVACFLSHCGWNSTVEAQSSGVPIVCLPQWGDQVTNAVYLVDVFKTGVRLGRGESDEKIVSREVVAEKLLEATVGEKAVELRENARRWKKEAEATVEYGGSSDKNFGEFVDKLVANIW
ncbi:hypothetical protein F2Q69_00034547 [Brassica cretica]|uniref:Glycosyltransferase N-terminal domain-containing protein n=1 Tax=Brassica cretica TaxID=69181 RepID=A0A8S9SJY2_BRACR|nr:hypothetical protein F2Q69_00034547 [Brassica cretica]